MMYRLPYNPRLVPAEMPSCKGYFGERARLPFAYKLWGV